MRELMTKTTLVIAVVIGLWLGGAFAGAQDADTKIDAKGARAVALEFLSQGYGAPLPTLDEKGVAALELEERTSPDSGKVFELRGKIPGKNEKGPARGWSLEITETGKVASFEFPSSLFLTGKTEAERGAELARRTKLSLDDAAKLARDFLKRRYARFDERVFELVEKKTRVLGGLAFHGFGFEERPRPGVLACYPNRIALSIDPETEDVTSFHATDLDIEVRGTVKVNGPAAQEKARAALTLAKGEKVAATNAPWLIARRHTKTGKPQAVWLVGFAIERAKDAKLDCECERVAPQAVSVDALTGETQVER